VSNFTSSSSTRVLNQARISAGVEVRTAPFTGEDLAFFTALPEPGAIIHGSVLRVRLRLTGATIVPYTSARITPDKGHVHLYVDGKVVSMVYGLDQTIRATPGPHLLQAEFVATDHFPFNPRVINTVTFTVR
jgi:hypothetical protein